MADRVDVSVTIAAEPELVFRYFTDPVRLASWLGEGSVLGAEAGGAVSVRYPDGSVAIGEVKRIVRNQLIEFTWGYEGGRHGLPPGSSTVVIRLTPVPDGTRVTLEHSGLAGADQRFGQRAGWRYQLGRLTGAVTEEALGPVVPEVVSTYFQAWNEADSAARSELLQRCMEDDATFRDSMNTSTTRADLDETIGVTRSIASGLQLQGDGVLQHCKGGVLFGWRVTDADGRMVAQGINYGELSSRGKLRQVVGFWR